MTKTEQKRWTEIFSKNLDEAINQLKWIRESPQNCRVMANRIGISGRTKEFVLHALMPTGLREALSQKYPDSGVTPL
jgi:hypothetical protein